MNRTLTSSNLLVYQLNFYIKQGNLAKIREILRLDRLDEKQAHTVLFCAVLNEKLEIVSELLTRGCEVTLSGDSAPFRMALLTGNPKIVDLLVAHGADLLVFASKNPDIFRGTGNHLCRLVHYVIRGRVAEVKATLRNVQLSQVMRYEIMRLAVDCGDVGMVLELLALGFEINIKSIDCKQSPLEIALNKDDYEMAELLEKEKSYLF